MSVLDVFFFVTKMNRGLTGLEWHNDIIFIFGVNYPFKSH